MTETAEPRCDLCVFAGCECPEGYAVTHCECPTCGSRFGWVEARCNNEPRLCPHCVGEVRVVGDQGEESE